MSEEMTIVMIGNEFAGRISQTINREYYTEWKIKYMIQYDNYVIEQVIPVRENLSMTEIDNEVVQNTINLIEETTSEGAGLPPWLERLKMKKEMNSGCEYCENKRVLHRDNLTASSEFKVSIFKNELRTQHLGTTELYAIYDGEVYDQLEGVLAGLDQKIEIKYCPMCGKKIGGYKNERS